MWLLAGEGDDGVVGTDAKTETAVPGEDGHARDQGEDHHHPDVEISCWVATQFEHGHGGVVTAHGSQHGGERHHDKLVRRPVQEIIGNEHGRESQQHTSR